MGARALRHPQRRHRRPRRSRQDDARRRDALAVRSVPREPGRRRARHGHRRPGAREGDHDPRQEHGRPLPRDEDQHRRHAGPCGLRRRGRARADDGRRRPPAGRRQRRPSAPDPVRAAQGARVAAAGDPRRQQGRPAGRADRRGRRTRCTSSSSTSTPTRAQIEFPIVYSNARAGPRRPRRRRARRRSPAALRRDRLAHPRSRPTTRAIPLQALVTNLDASPYVGRLALCRVVQGTIKRAQQVAWCRADGTIEKAKVTELYVTDALDRVEAEEAGPGEIIAVAGIPEVTIGETLADPDDPRPLPVFTVDEPSLSMTVGINTSPLAGREGDKVTATQRRGAAARRARRQRRRCGWSRPSGRTPGKCRAAASSSSRCWSSRCAARASS